LLKKKDTEIVNFNVALGQLKDDYFKTKDDDLKKEDDLKERILK
jgi:hypothetical protein